MSEPWTHWSTWRLRQAAWQKERDLLVEEVPVGVFIGQREITALMATPGRERELAAGFAVTMGWAGCQDPAPALDWNPQLCRVRLDLAGKEAPASGPRASGGGPLGPLEAPLAPDDFSLEMQDVLSLANTMAQTQELFRKTGATHAAALFDRSGRHLVTAEDVGRHNAVDKAVGALWLQGRLTEARAAALSGRLSLEMVLKGARAGLGLLLSVSAPSAPAVRKAQELGITLAGFSRGAQVNIYTHPHRITLNGKPLAPPE